MHERHLEYADISADGLTNQHSPLNFFHVHLCHYTTSIPPLVVPKDAVRCHGPRRGLCA